MFCPSCGREDSHEHKFCPSCGTNLKAILQALSDNAEGSFAKVDKSLDKFIARYAEHVFKDAPVKALEQRVGRSWKILGQGILTSLFDLALFSIMFMLLPFRFFILLIRTPIRLLSERNRNRKNATSLPEDKDLVYLNEAPAERWQMRPVASVTEHTTVGLAQKSSKR
jgi:hypothetical protein